MGVETWTGDGINYESIAVAKRDVIFAIYESIDQPTHERLFQIAATVARPVESQGGFVTAVLGPPLVSNTRTA